MFTDLVFKITYSQIFLFLNGGYNTLKSVAAMSMSMCRVIFVNFVCKRNIPHSKLLGIKLTIFKTNCMVQPMNVKDHHEETRQRKMMHRPSRIHSIEATNNTKKHTKYTCKTLGATSLAVPSYKYTWVLSILNTSH